MDHLLAAHIGISGLGTDAIHSVTCQADQRLAYTRLDIACRSVSSLSQNARHQQDKRKCFHVDSGRRTQITYIFDRELAHILLIILLQVTPATTCQG